MPDKESEEEYEEIKKRRTGGISQLVKNISDWKFIAVIILIAIFILLLRDETIDRRQIFAVGIVIIALVFFFSKKAESTSLISEEVAKRIAVEALENKKEQFHIPSDSDISPTNYCRLQRKMGEPFEWHIGIKVEESSGKITHFRVDIEPYDGIITGIVNEEFDGTSTPDIVLLYPDYYKEEY